VARWAHWWIVPGPRSQCGSCKRTGSSQESRPRRPEDPAPRNGCRCSLPGELIGNRNLKVEQKSITWQLTWNGTKLGHVRIAVYKDIWTQDNLGKGEKRKTVVTSKSTDAKASGHRFRFEKTDDLRLHVDELDRIAISQAQDIGTHVHNGVLVPDVAPTGDRLNKCLFAGNIRGKLTKLLM